MTVCLKGAAGYVYIFMGVGSGVLHTPSAFSGVQQISTKGYEIKH